MCNHLGRIGLLLAAACISNESVDIGSASAATSIELFAKYGPYGTIIWPYARSYGTYGALRLIRMRQYGFPDNYTGENSLAMMHVQRRAWAARIAPAPSLGLNTLYKGTFGK